MSSNLRVRAGSVTKWVDAVGSGEILVPKIPSYRIGDVAEAIGPSCKQEIVGIRPGEKLHEQMIGTEDAPYAYEYAEHYKILPAIHSWNQDPNRINGGKLVDPEFTYCSNNNVDWMSIDTLRSWVEQYRAKGEKI